MHKIISTGRRVLAFLLTLAVLNMQWGCYYYKVRTRPSPDAKDVATRISVAEKYIIIHQGDSAWHLKAIALNDVQTTMTGELDEVSSFHKAYLKKRPVNRPAYGPIRYRPARSKATHEVHIYLDNNGMVIADGKASIPLSSIRRMEIYDLATGATIASHVFGTLGVIAGTAVVLLIIIAATKSSCPFLSVGKDGTWQFIGEMYGGAIAAPLARDDYMPLPGTQPAEGVYQVKIGNELQERQYTDLASLLVIDHPAGTSVLIDKLGNVQTIAQSVHPQSAASAGHDYTQSLLATDSAAFVFNDPDKGNPAFSSLTMAFEKPASAKSGKLVLNAKNSYWLDYMFGKFTEQFGTRYEKFAESQKKKPEAESKQWSLEQGIPLSVYVETTKGWELKGYFDVMGPLASRDIVMPIDLNGVIGKDVRVKLECGRMFWEVNSAAMDFTENVPVTVMSLSPSSAIDEGGNDVKGLLSAADSKYMEQPDIGNEVIADFAAPPQATGTQRSLFFHSRGYYEYIRHYTNRPNLVRLRSFRKAGSFTDFAAAWYNELLNQRALFATVLNN